MKRSVRDGPIDSPEPVQVGNRFPRGIRLLDADGYGNVFRSGKRYPNPDMVLIARPNGLTFARLGFAIGKKAVPHAVQRNRLKRVGRESFRRHHGELPGVDIVLLARRGLGQRTNAALFDLLSDHWRRIAKHYRTPNG
ncbi:MAG: ribonuclease P protein component [Gammaproteobacteria bacterium]